MCGSDTRRIYVACGCPGAGADGSISWGRKAKALLAIAEIIAMSTADSNLVTEEKHAEKGNEEKSTLGFVIRAGSSVADIREDPVKQESALFVESAIGVHTVASIVEIDIGVAPDTLIVVVFMCEIMTSGLG